MFMLRQHRMCKHKYMGLYVGEYRDYTVTAACRGRSRVARR